MDLAGGDAEAAAALQSAKVKSLMRSIDSLKEQVRTLTAASKEHRRSAQIQTLRKSMRELELVNDVLKEELSTRASMTPEEVNEMVIKRTVGGPKRFRPKSREELAQDLSELERKYRRAAARVKALSDEMKALRSGAGTGNVERGREDSGGGAGACVVDEDRTLSGGLTLVPTLRAAGDEASRRITVLQAQVEELGVQVEAKAHIIAEQSAEIDGLHTRLRRLQALEDKSRRVAAKYAQSKEALESLRSENVTAVGAREGLEEELRRLGAENQWLKGEVERSKDEVARARHEHVEELNDLQARNAQLTDGVDALRREAASAAEDRMRARRAASKVEENTKLHVELKEIRAELALRTDEKGELEDAMAALRRDLEEKEEELVAVKETVRQRKREADDALREAQRLEGEVGRLTIELHAHHPRDVDADGRSVPELARELEEERAAHLENESALRNALAKVEELEAERVESASAAKALKQQVNAAKQLYRQESKKVAALEAELTALKADITAASGTSDAVGTPDKVAIDALKTEVRSLEQELDSARADAASSQTDVESLKRRLAAAEKKANKFKDMWDEARREGDESRERLVTAAKGTTPSGAPSADVVTLQSALQAATSESEALREEVDRLTAEVDSAEMSVEICRTAFNKWYEYARVLLQRLDASGQSAPAPPPELKELAEKMMEEPVPAGDSGFDGTDSYMAGGSSRGGGSDAGAARDEH